MEKEIVYCRETLVVHTSRIMPSETNSYGNLFGGALLSKIDNVSSISANRFARGGSVMTASLDSMNFLKPLPENSSVCIESFVSGAGRRSIEVFLKIICENIITGDRHLAATAFATFVTVPRDGVEALVVPKIVAESEEEIYICNGYEARRKARLDQKASDKELASILSTEIPWAPNSLRK